jgi:hypothetical protein
MSKNTIMAKNTRKNNRNTALKTAIEVKKCKTSTLLYVGM